MNEFISIIAILAIGILSYASEFCPKQERIDMVKIETEKKANITCLLGSLNQPDDPPKANNDSENNQRLITISSSATVGTAGTASLSPSSSISSSPSPEA
ncbi:hypothetical protein C4559_00920 [Candidatus Microgenomates bacterium]|nr:MAG: hypothetical protein C4559_00920 [Candidatus Microgenomates bacterium]